MIKKVISGGQRGADIAGLRAAKSLGIETGGWMPKDFQTLDGPRSEYADEYSIRELPEGGYNLRTFRNVKESDITLRFAKNFNTYGEQCTANAVIKYHKQAYDIKLERISGDVWEMEPSYEFLAEEIKTYSSETQIINIAGNAFRDIEEAVELYVRQLLEVLNGEN